MQNDVILDHTFELKTICALICLGDVGGQNKETRHSHVICIGCKFLGGLSVVQLFSSATAFVSGTAPLCLAGEPQFVADIDSRCRLRSASSSSLYVPRTSHSAIEHSAPLIAAANSLEQSAAVDHNSSVITRVQASTKDEAVRAHFRRTMG